MKTSKKQSGAHDHDKNGGDSEDRHQAIISLAYDDWEEMLELLDIDEVKCILTQTLVSLKTLFCYPFYYNNLFIMDYVRNGKIQRQ